MLRRLILVLAVALSSAGLGVATAAATTGVVAYDYDEIPQFTPVPETMSADEAQDPGPVGRAPAEAFGVDPQISADRVAPGSTPRVTEPMIRNAMTDVPLQSQQGAVSLPKVQSAVDQLAAGSLAPPIRVDGSIIVDGNHRYVAGQMMDDVPAVQPWPGGNSSRVVPWWKQVIDPTDWGG